MTFIHTADWQLGKPFAGIEDIQKRSLVQQERINAIHRIAEAARQHQAQFVLIAGDLFDSATATRATVSAACGAIGAFKIPVYAIPGNHDHAGPGGIWDQPFFQRERDQLAPNLTVLTKSEPVELDSVVLFPCPLLRRHEPMDTTAWLRSIPDLDQFGSKPRIILAHGSIQDFGLQDTDDESESEGANLIDLSRISDNDFDYIALGDWHGTKQVGPKAWYSGTPEIDRFPKGAEYDPGNTLVVKSSRGALPEVTKLPTSRLAWNRLECDLIDDAAIDRLQAQFNTLTAGRVGLDLVRLEIRGSLSLESTTRLEHLLESLQARLLRLKFVNNTTILPSSSEINALASRASDPLISRVAAALIQRASNQTEDATIARIALRELHALCNGQNL